jgi:hypothetical protein
MKRLFTLLMALPCIGLAQNFSFVSGNLVEEEINLEAFEIANCNILNESDESVIFVWELILFDNPEDWDFSVCDYVLCYTEGETTGTMTAVDGESEEAFIRANIYALTPGVGTYKFTVWDESIPDAKDTVTFIVTALDVTGIEEELTADNLGIIASNPNQVEL